MVGAALLNSILTSKEGFVGDRIHHVKQHEVFTRMKVRERNHVIPDSIIEKKKICDQNKHVIEDLGGEKDFKKGLK